MLLRALFISTLLVHQADPARQARELVEKLNSGKIEVREAAAEALREMGKTAIPERLKTR